VIRSIAVFDGTPRRVRVMLTARFCQRDSAIRKRMRVGERNAAIFCPGRRRRWTDRLLIKGKRSLPLPYLGFVWDSASRRVAQSDAEPLHAVVRPKRRVCQTVPRSLT
jgi:hypothetical protein